jgi:hypothetical protein
LRKKKPFPKISAEDAHAALRWLHATGKVTSSDIVRALRKRDQLVEEIKQRLEELGGKGLWFPRNKEGLRRRPKRGKASAKARAAWKAQGRYLAALKPLSKANRLKVSAIRERSGIRAALAAGRALVKAGLGPSLNHQSGSTHASLRGIDSHSAANLMVAPAV